MTVRGHESSCIDSCIDSCSVESLRRVEERIEISQKGGYNLVLKGVIWRRVTEQQTGKCDSKRKRINYRFSVDIECETGSYIIRLNTNLNCKKKEKDLEQLL